MKRKSLLLAAVMGLSLAGCTPPAPQGGDTTDVFSKYTIKPECSGGTDAEKGSLYAGINGNIALISKSGALSPDAYVSGDSAAMELKEDEGDYLYLTTTAKAKSKVDNKRRDVTYTWTCDHSQAGYDSEAMIEGNTIKLINIKYPGFGGAESQFKFTLSKVQCGDCVANPNLTYTMTVKPAKIQHTNYNIAEYQKVNAEHRYEHASYDDTTHTAKFPANNSTVDGYATKHYIAVYGKVIYVSPDGNWGLIADGDDVAEIYAGSAYNLTTDYYPDLQIGNLVCVKGQDESYNGIPEISIIRSIKKVTNAELPAGINEVQNPTGNFIAMNKADLQEAYFNINYEIPVEGKASLERVARGYYSAMDGWANSLRSVTGKYVPGSLKADDAPVTDANVDTIAKGARFTFNLELDGGEIIQIANDYHTTSKYEVKKGIVDKLLDIVKNPNTAYTIKGTFRYGKSGKLFYNDYTPAAEQDYQYNQDGNVISYKNDGSINTEVKHTWSIVPFEENHIVAA